jgi:hypothetical protein
VHEVDPRFERVRPAALAVAERRQVERVDAMVRRELRGDAVPDPRGLDEPADEDDRRSLRAPVLVRDVRSLDVNERARVELARRERLVGRDGVVDERREREQRREDDESDDDPAEPASQEVSVALGLPYALLRAFLASP